MFAQFPSVFLYGQRRSILVRKKRSERQEERKSTFGYIKQREAVIIATETRLPKTTCYAAVTSKSLLYTVSAQSLCSCDRIV